ncbi:hypothetical protein Tco_1256667 [Tanacetum coccineum]
MRASVSDVRYQAESSVYLMFWARSLCHPHCSHPTLLSVKDLVKITLLEATDHILNMLRKSLLFVITSFGGVVLWEGDGVPFEEI